MQEQKIYDVAEWLVHQSSGLVPCLRKNMKNIEAKRKHFDDPFMIELYRTGRQTYIKHMVVNEIRNHFELSQEELNLIFDDERVLVILNSYYIKELL
jgi:predicted PolB exonuclease-like 3'-5' exonuclease